MPRPWPEECARRRDFDAVAAISVALALGACGSVTIGLTLACALASLAIAGSRLSWCQRGWCLVALAVGWVRAESAQSEYLQARTRAWGALRTPARCAFSGEVTKSPVWQAGAFHFAVLAGELDCEGRTHPGPWTIQLTGETPALGRGSQVEVIADLGISSLFRNFDLPSPVPGATRRGHVLSGSVQALVVERPGRSIRGLIDRLRARVRAGIRRDFSPAAEGLARALVLGESDLGQETLESFQVSGLAHLLAVSGSHLVLAVGSVVRVLGACLGRVSWLTARLDGRRVAAGLGIPLSLLYADFAGGSGSAWRAAWMLSAALLTTALGRRPRISRALACATVVGWLFDPLLVFDYSFLLSIGASAGLVLLGPSSDAPCGRSSSVRRWGTRAIEWAHRGAITTLSATAPGIPVLLLLGPSISLASVAANVFACPLGELVALPVCLLHALLVSLDTASLPTMASGVLAALASFALRLMASIAQATAAAPGLTLALPLPTAAELGLFVVFLLAVCCCVCQAWGAPARGQLPPLALGGAIGCLLLLACAEQVARCQGSASAGGTARLRVSVLDVGQGDALLVDLPDGRLMLVDAGGNLGRGPDPGAQVIAPILRARRRTRVDVVALTHPHPDHFGGLARATRDVEVGEIWLGQLTQASPLAHPSELQTWLGNMKQRGVPILSAEDLCHRPLGAAGYELEVLSPCPLDPARNVNDNSLVLRARFGRHQALLMGDAEHETEAALLNEAPELLPSNFLKLGHHGSNTSSSATFIAAVSPDFSAISCGARNRFGHPHPSTLFTLEQSRTHVLRLDADGAVEWQSDGEAQRYRLWRRRQGGGFPP